MTGAAEACLLYVLLPAWILAGAADWACHYRARIERTTGWRESLIHLALLAEAGIAVLAGLLFEVTGGVLFLMIICFVAHEITGYLDVRYASAVRGVSPLEQKVHDYMIAVPFAALVLVAVMHWPAAQSIVGAGPEAFDASFRLKADPLPMGYVAGILLLISLFNLLPYAQEFWRGLRVALVAKRREPPPGRAAAEPRKG